MYLEENAIKSTYVLEAIRKCRRKDTPLRSLRKMLVPPQQISTLRHLSKRDNSAPAR